MRLMSKVTLFLFIVILVIMVPSVILIWQNMQQGVMEQAHTRAKTIYEMIVVTRQWVAENGERIEPVPAQATKEISEFAHDMTTFRFHISSDKLMNPENAPNEFEKEAIAHLRTGAMEYFSVTGADTLDGGTYNYAAPLLINESCLSCHGIQDYRINDFRGVISVSFPMEEITAPFKDTNIAILTVVIVSLVMVIITVCLLIYLMITRHLLVLTDAAKLFSAGTRKPSNLKTNDEMQDLSEAFDSMTSQIVANEDVLKAKLDEAVENYKRLVVELDDNNKKLNSLNQLKTDFLDSIAHEIRTPLTKILSNSELLTDPRILQDEIMRDKFASSMKLSINSIRTMFNDIITISRLEHDQHKYQKIPVKLHSLVSETLDMFELDMISKNISPVINVNREDVIHVDGETFSIVISNLVSNAIKYSHDNDKITIEGYTDNENGNYVITCRDNGIGIPQDMLNNVFIRFFRAENVKKTYAGTGLGLSITHRIVKDHHGAIEIKSVEGEYTQVIIRLPLSVVAVADEDIMN